MRSCGKTDLEKVRVWLCESEPLKDLHPTPKGKIFVSRLELLFISERLRPRHFLRKGDNMNKRFLSILFVIMLLAFTSCAKEKTNSSSNTEQTSSTSLIQQSHITGNCNKDNVSEFMNVFVEHLLAELPKDFVFDEEHCYNVTPESIAEETSAQIFKFSDSCASFIYLNDQVYPLGGWFGGYGFVSAVPCDFDNDGHTDILYTYSCGSGIHHSVIAVFNIQTMENTVIYDSPNTDNPQVDFYLSTQSTNIDSTNIEMPTHFEVYTVDIEVIDDNFANLDYIVTGIAGSVETENGIPVFHRTC